MMTLGTLHELRQLRAAREAELAQIDQQIREKLSQTIVRCSNKECSRGYELRELEYIQTHWYEPPYSCTMGDRWIAGDGKWRCPACKKLNTCDLETRALSHCFQSRIDTY